ncbi:hypothetical protein KCP70_10295 [Salmonella enterica subsp. enterica]|nr:hypothetical protein KCP70_10295 [Salmonella enterica subsp. enterica]
MPLLWHRHLSRSHGVFNLALAGALENTVSGGWGQYIWNRIYYASNSDDE